MINLIIGLTVGFTIGAVWMLMGQEIDLVGYLQIGLLFTIWLEISQFRLRHDQ